MKKIHITYLILFALFAFLSSACYKLMQPPIEIRSDDPPVYTYNMQVLAEKSELPQNISILFKVYTNKNTPVSDLSLKDFIIMEDENDEITSVNSAELVDGFNVKLKTAFLINVNTANYIYLHKIISNITSYVNNMMDNQEIAIYTFSDAKLKLIDFTSDKTALLNAINSISISSNSETRLYDAVKRTCEEIYEKSPSKTIENINLIIFTNEDDDNSTSINDVLYNFNQDLVYIIDIGNGIDNNEITELPGYFHSKNAENLEETMSQMNKKLEEGISGTYLLTYLTPKTGKESHTTKISFLKLECNMENYNGYDYCNINFYFYPKDFYKVKGTPPSKAFSPIPADGAIDVLDYILSWDCTDKENSNIKYDLYLSTYEYPNLFKEGITKKSDSLTYMYNSTKYYWKIIATDSDGNISESDTWTFTTAKSFPPPTPKPTYPSPNSIVSILYDQIELAWAGSGKSYSLYFGNSNPPDLYEENLTNVRKTVTAFRSEKYFWKLVAKNSYGQTTESPIWSFDTEANLKPGPIELGQPSNNGEIPSTATGYTLKWACTDPDKDLLKYSIYFGTSDPPPFLSEYTTTPYNLDGKANVSISPGNKYYWQIKATDSYNEVSTGPVWSFTTQAVINKPPVLTSFTPADASIITTTTGKTLLSWKFTDPEYNTLTFKLYFGTNSSPNLIASNLKAATYTATVESGQVYYWYIIADDNAGGTTNSGIKNFFVL